MLRLAVTSSVCLLVLIAYPMAAGAQVSDPGAPAAIDEGGTAVLDASGSSPGGGATISSYSWDCGNGDAPYVGGVVFTGCSYADDGLYTVELTVVDSEGGTDTASVSLVVNNVNPAIVSSYMPSGSEGQTLVFTSAATDPAGADDPLSYSWDFADGTAVVTGSSVQHVFADNGTYAVTITVEDDDGGTTSETTDVVIANASPVINSLSGDTTGVEGGTFSFVADPSDPGASDTWSTTWDFDDGTPVQTGDFQDHVFADDGAYTVHVTVEDDDGGTATSTLAVVVSNVDPTIVSLSTTPATDLSEGVPVALASVATDPGDDTLSYSWAPGDGTSPLSGDEVVYTYADDGIYTVTLTVSDEDGGSTQNTHVLTVLNTAPTIEQVTGDTTGVEGQSRSFSAVVSDPGSVDLGSLDLSWDFGDGTAPVFGDSVVHEFGDEGSYSVVLTATDLQLASDSQMLVVHIDNVAPVFSSSASTSALEGVAYTYSPTVVDPGNDVLTYSLSAAAPTGMALDSGTGELSWTPDFDDAGIGDFAVTLTVSDGDGGTDSQSWTVSVSTADADADGIPDGWEDANGLDPNEAGDAVLDPDEDGLSSAAEYAIGQDPLSYDGPSQPVPLSPLDDEEVADTHPDLVLENGTDPQGDLLTYSFEVYGDPSLMVYVPSSSDVAEDPSGQTSWKLDVPLSEGESYFWRARASDAWVDTAWTETGSFLVNAAQEPPALPSPVYPVSGETVSTTLPALQWTAVTDVDGDEVTYSVRLYSGSDSTLVVEDASGLEGGDESGVESWAPTEALDEDAHYNWSVAAVDEGGLSSAWTDPEPFFVSAEDEAPEAPLFVSPSHGDVLESRSPDLSVGVVTDPEGGDVVYVFEVDSTDSFDGDDYQTATESSSLGGLVTWSLSLDGLVLPENATAHARVRAVDDAGISSSPTTISFYVRGPNDTPPVPALVSPVDMTEGEDAVPVLVAENVVEPEGDTVFFDFVVASDLALSQVLAGGEDLGVLMGSGSLAEEGQTSWQPSVQLQGTELYWSVRAVDEFGAASAWAEPWLYSVLVEEPPVAPDEPSSGCSCFASISADSAHRPSLAALVALGLALGVLVGPLLRRKPRTD